MEKFLDVANNLLWNYILIVALLGVGVFLSFKLGFPQLTRFTYAFKALFSKDEKNGTKGISPFQALSTAVAAQVGTGNIVGVASAIAAGGPGAAFWMILSAFFGMSTIFSEAVLAITYREETRSGLVGGPAYYIKNGLKNKGLASFFAITCICASMAIGIMVQSNAIANSVTSAFSISKITVTVVLLLVVVMILIGGIKRISSFAEKVVPFMAILYILATIAILIIYNDKIIFALKSIVTGAFNPKAIGGGALGITIQSTIRFGLARGLFSNEAGMGSTPHSHALANVKHPADQGFVAMMGVFVSTFMICTSTAIINLVSGSYDPSISAEVMAKSSTLMTQKAFVMTFGPIGEMFLSVCLSMFALTTIVGWYYFSESNVRFISSDNKTAVMVFKYVVMGLLVLGALLEAKIVWKLADFFMALMVLPNIYALFKLSNKTKEVLDDWNDKKF